MTSKSLSFKRIPWVFFDLDDTIWNFRVNSDIALRKVYQNSPILRKFFNDPQQFIDIYHEHNSRLWLMYGNGEVSAKELKLERWRRTLATCQFEVLTAVCEELENNYLDILVQCTEEVKSVKKILDEISKYALIGVLSNGFLHTQYQKIKYSGLNRYITRLVVSDEIGINKPDKRLFDYAVDETGATPPFLMVGDNTHTDIIGAMNAGWFAIRINNSGKDDPLSLETLNKNGVDSKLLLADVVSLEEALPIIRQFIINH